MSSLSWNFHKPDPVSAMGCKPVYSQCQWRRTVHCFFVIAWMSDDGKTYFVVSSRPSPGGEFKRQVQETDFMGTLASILINMWDTMLEPFLSWTFPSCSIVLDSGDNVCKLSLMLPTWQQQPCLKTFVKLSLSSQVVNLMIWLSYLGKNCLVRQACNYI